MNNQSKSAKTAAPTTAPAIAPLDVPDFFVGASLEAGPLDAEVDDDDALLTVPLTVGDLDGISSEVDGVGIEEVLSVIGLEGDDEAGATCAIVWLPHCS